MVIGVAMHQPTSPTLYPERMDASLPPALQAMGLDPDGVTVTLLTRGWSGASVYHVRSPRGDLILKVAGRDSPRPVGERFRRELSFYRELAPIVPLRTPTLIAGHDDHHADPSDESSAIWLCLRAHAISRRWTAHRYRQVAAGLGRLHAAFPLASSSVLGPAEESGEGARSSPPWIPPVWPKITPLTSDPSEGEVAFNRWIELSAHPPFRHLLTPPVLAGIEAQIATIGRLDAILAAMPVSLCHGDAHRDNTLMGPRGAVVWADWQEVQLGPGAADLSFFIERAWVGGGDVPEDAMLDTYLAAYTASGRVLSPAELRRATAAAGARTILLHWPYFVGGWPPRRLRALLDRLTVRLAIFDGAESKLPRIGR